MIQLIKAIGTTVTVKIGRFGKPVKVCVCGFDRAKGVVRLAFSATIARCYNADNVTIVGEDDQKLTSEF